MLNARKIRLVLAAMVAAAMLMVCAGGAGAAMRVDGKAGWRSGRAQAETLSRRAPLADVARSASARWMTTLGSMRNGLVKFFEPAREPGHMPSGGPVND